MIANLGIISREFRIYTSISPRPENGMPEIVRIHENQKMMSADYRGT
jgi:hypothetical protein